MRTRFILVAAILASVSIAGCSNIKQGIRRETIGSVRARGNESLSRGDLPSALRAFQEIVERHPESAQGRYDVGRTLMAMDDPIGASEEFMIAHRRQPWMGEFTDGLAEALFVSERRDILFELLRREATQNEIARDYLRLGQYAARDGAMEEAIDAFEAAAELAGVKDTAAHIEMADLYRTLGQTDMEVKELRHVLYAEPGNPDAHARLRELNEVPGPSFAIEPGDG